MSDTFQCPYCGYFAESWEFYEEEGEDTPYCPDCGEDLTGDFVTESSKEFNEED